MEGLWAEWEGGGGRFLEEGSFVVEEEVDQALHTAWDRRSLWCGTN